MGTFFLQTNKRIDIYIVAGGDIGCPHLSLAGPRAATSGGKGAPITLTEFGFGGLNVARKKLL